MISLKKYLESEESVRSGQAGRAQGGIFSTAVCAYGATLGEMGNSSQAACPGLGDGLKRKLEELRTELSEAKGGDEFAATANEVCEQLREWGGEAAKHIQEKTREVKDLLLAMARTAESVSARDERSAGQMSEVTSRLKAIASLEDLTEIRVEVERSATELRASIDRMAAEGKAVLEELREQVAGYQSKLEEAERIAARDTLTGLGNRLYVEGELEKRMLADAAMCVAIIDIDSFKKVNDEHGHLTGDELLKQFGRELRSACRATDAIGRWGGDEFMVLFDCGLREAEAQMERVRKWICGSYTLMGRCGELKLQVKASIGLAARAAGEETRELLARADAAMYAQKAAMRSKVA